MKYRIPLGLVACVVLLGVIPSGALANGASSVGQTLRAKIESVERVSFEGTEYTLYHLILVNGPQRGQRVTSGGPGSTELATAGDFRQGQKVFVAVIEKDNGVKEYVVQDHDRLNQLGWLALLFVMVVIWFSRWRGARSIIGLIVSFAVIVGWMVPLIATGSNPVLVTIVGSTVILVGGFLLTEGRSRLTAAAMLGTTMTMLFIGALSTWATSFSQLSGMSSEETLYLSDATGQAIDLRGLLLAGIIVGTLGILDDVAVSQAATVGELWVANPKLSRRQVYQAAMRVGRSHLVAIINTLTLAYAGSALPLLVLFSSSSQSKLSILNSELVATEIVRSIVGSIGLILALPLSTLAAVMLRVRGESGHHHGVDEGVRYQPDCREISAP